MGHAPTEEVGFVSLIRLFALMVSCCLRQPRIASGGCPFFYHSRTVIAVFSVDRETTGANALRLIWFTSRVPRSGSSGRACQVAYLVL